MPTSSGDGQAEDNGLHAGDGGAGGIFFADAPRHHGGGGQAQAEADGEHQAQQRFGEADGGDGVGAETADPEHVHHREQRLQHHFQNHGNGEQQNRAIEVARGEVLVRAAKRFADRAPQCWRRREWPRFVLMPYKPPRATRALT